jgi:hypothetical protein
MIDFLEINPFSAGERHISSAKTQELEELYFKLAVPMIGLDIESCDCDFSEFAKKLLREYFPALTKRFERGEIRMHLDDLLEEYELEKAFMIMHLIRHIVEDKHIAVRSVSVVSKELNSEVASIKQNNGEIDVLIYAPTLFRSVFPSTLEALIMFWSQIDPQIVDVR